jgi:hypothetical protein
MWPSNKINIVMALVVLITIFALSIHKDAGSNALIENKIVKFENNGEEYYKVITECGTTAKQVECLGDIASEALITGQFKKLSKTILRVEQENPNMANICHESLSNLGELAIKTYPDPTELIANTDERICNGSMGESIMTAYAMSNVDDSLWLQISRACALDIKNVDDGHTSPCAKGLGRGISIAFEEDDISELFSRCMRYLDASEPTKILSESISYYRLYYGCAHGVIMDKFASLKVENWEMIDPEIIVSECIPLATLRTKNYSNNISTLLNGCAGASGATFGLRLMENIQISNSKQTEKDVKNFLAACDTITDATKGEIGIECHRQIFRQASQKVFSSEKQAKLFCDKIAVRDTISNKACKDESMKRFDQS